MKSRLKPRGPVHRRPRPARPAVYRIDPEAWYAVVSLHTAAPVSRADVRQAVQAGELVPVRGGNGQRVVDGRAVLAWLGRHLKRGK